MEMETDREKENNNNICEAETNSSVDWRGRPSNSIKHGGMKAAAFVLGLQGLEIMGIAAVGNNLITYVINEMHFSLSESANIVTNFIGTVFILSLLGGYLSDSYLASFWTLLIFAFVELSGFILLSVQAHLPHYYFKAELSFCPSIFRFLDKACIKVQDGNNTKEISRWRLCTLTQVEQVKILISVIPIFACTIIFNTILAQLQTFSVQQGSTMNTKLTKNFHIPPASLQSIPYILLIFIVPLYDTFFVPFARKFTDHDSGITPLQRIGLGLFIATFSMVSAALMENKRRISVVNENKTISIFWITPQFLIFGITAVGLIEFFYKQSLKGMQSFLTAITYCSYSFGFYLSSLLVSLVNKTTSNSSHGGWLSGNNLNKDRLDLFYWLLAVLSFLNFLNYLFWATWYSKNQTSSATIQQDFNSKVVGDDSIA
nr:protein NRT1/ PTR FAMILY 4.3-like [Nicotiana tomentosiformis]